MSPRMIEETWQELYGELWNWTVFTDTPAKPANESVRNLCNRRVTRRIIGYIHK